MSRWSIPLDRLAAKYKADMQTVARKATFDVFTRVVQRSPVDTGRFRANWNVSYGSPVMTVTTATNASRATAEVAKALTGPVGNVAYLTNALHYARKLEYGYSKQAPAGMVRLTAMEFADFVRRAAQ